MPRKRHGSSNPARNVPHPEGVQHSKVRHAQQDDLRNRVRGTNGSFPKSVSARIAPKPPAIAMFPEVLEMEAPGDTPEAVFGQYPRGFIAKILPWLRCERREILHVCSGSLPPGEGTRVDMRPAARPDVLANGEALPFADGTAAAVMLDPPYTEGYAKNLYGIRYPVPARLLREAARVTRPCGRIAFTHFMVAPRPPGCRWVKTIALSTGAPYQLRAVTIFEREQDGLFPA